jgi:flagellar basal-body rod modification protein FlgD
MNALISFRANAAGHLTPTVAQREASAERIASNLAARLDGIARARAKSATSAQKTELHAETATTPPMSNGMDRQAFLQLLVLELQNQDPTNPLDNREMVSQLAQFSALEAATNLNERFDEFAASFSEYTGNVDQLNFISAHGLLGKYVEGINETGEPVTGTVQSVHLEGSIVILGVDGQSLPMSGVMGVASQAPDGKRGG